MKNFTTKDIIKTFVKNYFEGNRYLKGEIIVEKILEALTNQQNVILKLNEEQKLIIYGEKTNEINKINKKIFLVYKYIYETFGTEKEEFNSMLLVENERILDLFCEYKKIIKEKEEGEFDLENLFRIHSVDEEHDINYKYCSERIKKFIGEIAYDLYNEHFLSEDKLKVKNAIYKIF